MSYPKSPSLAPNDALHSHGMLGVGSSSSSAFPDDRESTLRRTIKTLEKEIRKKDKQLREFCDAATELHHNMEEQEAVLTNQLLKYIEPGCRTAHRREGGVPATISPHHPSHTPVCCSRSESPGVSGTDVHTDNGAKDWKALYLEMEKRCLMLQHTIENMQNEVYQHRTRARKMLESITKPKEVIALAEIRAENIVDRKLHSMSRYRSGSISSTSSISECESTTPRDRCDSMSAALRAHTRTLLTSSVPIMNSPSVSGSTNVSAANTFSGNPDVSGSMSLYNSMSATPNTGFVQPLFQTMRDEMMDELRTTE